jgi:hypothetical protein
MNRACLLLIAGVLAVVCAEAQTQTPAPAPATPPAGLTDALKAVTGACKGETPQLCPGMSTDTALACLQTNMDKLTPGCKDAVIKAARAALGF